MRESIGGAWLLGFVIGFIVLFSAYLAVSVNYTKAFKVKNKIINLIEENEGFTTSSNIGDNLNVDLVSLEDDNTTEAKVFKFLKEIGYTYTDMSCPEGMQSFAGGYCIKKTDTSNGSYYKVTTYISFELPIIWLKLNIPISGETKVLYNVSDNM